MNDKTNLRIETVNEYCIVDEKNQIIKDGFCSEEEAAKWLEDAYGIKHEPKPQPKIDSWIPCSERLPEDGVDVLVWFEYFRYGEYNRLFQTKGISHTFDRKWSGFVNGQSGWSQLRIIAWQPLPEDYHE